MATETTPPGLLSVLWQAITEPETVTPRGKTLHHLEPADRWAARAAAEAVRPFLAKPAEPAPMATDPIRPEDAPRHRSGSPEQMLREFHSGAGLPLPGQPTARPELGSQTGRAKILAEEVRELSDAIDAGDITEIADACADVVYAAVGTAVTYGIPFDEVFRAVHVSNMTKLIPPVVINEDGKIVKGPHYEPPDIAAALGLAKGGTLDEQVPLSLDMEQWDLAIDALQQVADEEDDPVRGQSASDLAVLLRNKIDRLMPGTYGGCDD